MPKPHLQKPTSVFVNQPKHTPDCSRKRRLLINNSPARSSTRQLYSRWRHPSGNQRFYLSRRQNSFCGRLPPRGGRNGSGSLWHGYLSEDTISIESQSLSDHSPTRRRNERMEFHTYHGASWNWIFLG